MGGLNCTLCNNCEIKEGEGLWCNYYEEFVERYAVNKKNKIGLCEGWEW